MRKKVRKIIKERAVSVLLSMAMFVTSVPVQTFAQDKPQDIFRIAENGMTQDILDSDVFTCLHQWHVWTKIQIPGIILESGVEVTVHLHQVLM